MKYELHQSIDLIDRCGVKELNITGNAVTVQHEHECVTRNTLCHVLHLRDRLYNSAQ